MVDRDRPPHDLDDLGREQRIHGSLVDPEGAVPPDPEVAESRSPEFAGEDTRLEIDVRGRLVAAQIVRLPFYKRAK